MAVGHDSACGSPRWSGAAFFAERHRNPFPLRTVFVSMLFTRTDKTFRDMLNGARSSVAIIPASRPRVRDSENVQRASDVALLARANGMGVFVLEGRGRGTASRELLVLVVGDALQITGFARKVVRESDAASDWFLFGRPGDDLVEENVDWSQRKCVFKGDGFTLPDGGEFKFETAYTPAQFNTAWCHSMGADVGEYLKAV
jgi:hypothetical protein